MSDQASKRQQKPKQQSSHAPQKSTKPAWMLKNDAIPPLELKIGKLILKSKRVYEPAKPYWSAVTTASGEYRASIEDTLENSAQQIHIY